MTMSFRASSLSVDLLREDASTRLYGKKPQVGGGNPMTIIQVASGMAGWSDLATVTIRLVHSGDRKLPVAIELHRDTNGVDTVSF